MDVCLKIARIGELMRKFSNYWQKKHKKLYQELIITRNIPWYKQPLVLLSLSCCTLSILGSYLYLNYALEDTLKQLTSMSRRYNSLSEKYLELKIAKIKMQRALEIAQQSQVKIKDNLLTLHEQSQDLTEQVDLYKRIMANKGDEQVLIENVQVRQVDNSKEYSLSFLMLQASKNKNLLQGSIDVRFKGRSDDILKTLNYSKLAGSKNPLTYRFRDYQKINERIELPENFKIEEVIIAVTDHGTKQTKTKNFDWDLVGGQEINVAQK